MHVGGGGLVLDELDQLVAEDHLARRDRDVAAWPERLGGRRLAPGNAPFPILEDELRAAQEVSAALLDAPLQNLGIRQRKIRGRENVENLPGRELDHPFMLV